MWNLEPPPCLWPNVSINGFYELGIVKSTTCVISFNLHDNLVKMRSKEVKYLSKVFPSTSVLLESKLLSYYL